MLRVVVLTTILISVAIGTFYQLGYRINTSNSFPTGVWKIVEKKEYKLGDIVAFCPVSSPTIQLARKYSYLSWSVVCDSNVSPMIKAIAGFSGDKAIVRENYISINDITTEFIEIDPLGRKLTLTKSLLVPPLYFWAFSKGVYGFDSRYFGPVPMKSIIGKANLVIPF